MPLTLNGTTGITFPNGSAGTPALTGVDTDSGVIFGTDTVALATAGTQRLTIDSTGNVGIATNTPEVKLDVNGTISAFIGTFNAGGYKLKYYSGSGDSRSWWVLGDVHAYGDFAIRQSTTQSGSTFDSKFYISPTGNVGIGNTSPGSKFVVTTTNGSSTVYTIQTSSNSIINPNNSGSEIIGSQITLGGNIVLSERQPNTAFSDRTDLAIVTDTGYGLGKSEKIRIISNGDVELNQHYSSAPANAGRDSPTATFKGHGWNTSSGSVEVGTRLISTHNYWTGSYSNTFGQTYPDFKILIKNSDSASYVEKFAFQGNGVLRISQSGGGISFSPTSDTTGMTSELLSDYEEGTFTPTITGWTGTYSIQYGVYTKIGRQVFIHCEVQTTGGTGTFSANWPGVNNLPFSRDNTIPAYRHLGNWAFIGSGAVVPANTVGAGQWDGGPGTTSLFPNNFTLTGGVGNYDSQNAASNFGYRTFITYFTA